MLNLNEFQADWAAMPQVEKEKLEKLNNKTILVSGHSLARCLCYALVYQSERKNRRARVICAGNTALTRAAPRANTFKRSILILLKK